MSKLRDKLYQVLADCAADLKHIRTLLGEHMPTISDELAAIQKNQALTASGIANLDSLIQGFLIQLAASGATSNLSPADAATLKAIADTSATLAAAATAAVSLPSSSSSGFEPLPGGDSSSSSADTAAVGASSSSSSS